MVANKRVTDLTDFTSVLPYASELFGIYRPMLGWRSRRIHQRVLGALERVQPHLADSLSARFVGRLELQFDGAQLGSVRLGIGTPAALRPRPVHGTVLDAQISAQLGQMGRRPVDEEWREIFDPERLEELLNGPVLEAHRSAHSDRIERAHFAGDVDVATLSGWLRAALDRESVRAAVLKTLVDKRQYGELDRLFFPPVPSRSVDDDIADAARFKDPLATFDPTKELGDVSLSPVGIVHLFRQYFFELDTFLGTPVGHVWLSPGSMVELIETTTRRTLVEKTIQTTLETTRKAESSTTDQDELFTAVKQDNRSDMKLGFSTTVNQSWGTGSATATGNLNLDTTQQTAREETHKRSRQQTEKLSTEIRQNFASTFRTVTETADTSSKRYVLNNTTNDLLNYEMRRKMRQVGVQVQDVGSYLCWQTFVDDPGAQLALPTLIHIAKPADLVVVPNGNEIQMPPEWLDISFTGEMVWNFPDGSQQHGEDHPEVLGRFVPLATLDIPNIPNDYEVFRDPANPFLGIEKQVLSAADDDSWNAMNWGGLGMITADLKRVIVGVTTHPKPSGLGWNDRIAFKVGGALKLRLKETKRIEIDNANRAILSAKEAADVENQRRVAQEFVDSVKDRVTLASKIDQRRFEDLREEERTVVYRRLLSDLMTESLYRDLPDNEAGQELRHVLSELLNAIFDIDKMLYFVAPEWWKPRRRSKLLLGGNVIPVSIDGNTVRWVNDSAHDRYYIAEKSEPAPLGSSLGWLVQLDGDDLRNAFLNAPWVKAVIPIRPGKELAAINWLKSVGVEGADGLDAAYLAPVEELNAVRSKLLTRDPTDPVLAHMPVTIGDALRSLCFDVADKHAASLRPDSYPQEEVNDENRVSTTPLEKVFEHGFYPLEGGFRAVTEAPFEVFDQWIEVLPTDQVVPVPIRYNPRTGRQAAD